MKWSRLETAWLSPQNIVAALLCIGAVIAWLAASYEPSIPAPITPNWTKPTDTTSYERQQVSITTLFGEVERVILMDMELAPEMGQAVTQIMQQLQRTMAASWPAELSLKQVFTTTILTGKPSVILNFSHDDASTSSVAEEKALYESIVKTLEANGYTNYRILVNDALRPYFLEHIALPNGL